MKKYWINRGVVVLLIALALVCTIFSALPLPVSWVRDLFTVLASVVGSSLLFGVLIQKRDQNNLVDELIANEVLLSDFIVKNIPTDKATSLYEKLIRKIPATEAAPLVTTLERDNVFRGYRAPSEMMEKIRNKLLESIEEKYYLDECAFIVRVVPRPDCFEKHVLKSIEVRSYEDIRFPDFPLGNISTMVMPGRPPSSIVTSLMINGKSIDLKSDLTSIPIKATEPLDRFQGYTEKMCFCYNKPLNLSPQKSCRIEIQYMVRTPLEDLFASYRVPVPCRSYSLHYSVAEAAGYSLNAAAFGFSDNALETPVMDGIRHEVLIRLNNWIFGRDGAAVSMTKI